jgi:signal recognition particle GTPase
MYDAKVTVLCEQIDHHVEEEQNEMFPKVKKAKLDLEALGEEIQTMKESRQGQMMSGAKQSRSRGSSAHR